LKTLSTSPARPRDLLDRLIFRTAFLAAIRPVLNRLREGERPSAEPACPRDRPRPLRRAIRRRCRTLSITGKKPVQPINQGKGPPS
jgi:hypothetical protein